MERRGDGKLAYGHNSIWSRAEEIQEAGVGWVRRNTTYKYEGEKKVCDFLLIQL